MAKAASTLDHAVALVFAVRIYESLGQLVLHIKRCQSPVKIRHPHAERDPTQFVGLIALTTLSVVVSPLSGLSAIPVDSMIHQNYFCGNTIPESNNLVQYL